MSCVEKTLLLLRNARRARICNYAFTNRNSSISDITRHEKT